MKFIAGFMTTVTLLTLFLGHIGYLYSHDSYVYFYIGNVLVVLLSLKSK